jgi:GNAT superfamily N-acetyltransferase
VADVREPSGDDAEALVGLLRRGTETYRAFMPAGWTTVDDDPMFDAERLRTRLAMPGLWARVAEDDEGIVAFTMFEPHAEPETANFSTLFVEERAWGQGLGRSLLSLAIDEMRHQGYAAARLWVARDYPRARRTYEAAGWRPTGAEKVYETDGTPLVEYALDLR